MKRTLFSIFAHPDDESFGPSGTLLQEVRSGTDVHLICLTRGDAGRNTDGYEDLGAQRIKEWHRAGALLGASSMQHFGYQDGCLCNTLYHEIADKLEASIAETLAGYEEPPELNALTFDSTGLSGHLDHIAVSYIVTFVFMRLQQSRHTWRTGTLRYFCLPYDARLAHDTSYVYMPPGRYKHEFDDIRDVSGVFEQKQAVMRAHWSQREDAEWIIDMRGEALKIEQFRYLKS